MADGIHLHQELSGCHLLHECNRKTTGKTFFSPTLPTKRTFDGGSRRRAARVLPLTQSKAWSRNKSRLQPLHRQTATLTTPPCAERAVRRRSSSWSRLRAGESSADKGCRTALGGGSYSLYRGRRKASRSGCARNGDGSLVGGSPLGGPCPRRCS